MADTLATPADLASYLQQNLDTSTATVLLEAATGLVQGAVRQRLVQVANDTVVLDLDEHNGGLYLDLPERPVTAVGTVLIGATAVTDFKTQLRRARLWRADGWRSTLLNYHNQPSTVTVTYTHGYPTGDQRLQLARGIVLALAGQAYAEPSGVTSEAIDDYRVTYSQAIQRMDLTEHATSALRRAYGRDVGSARLTA